MSSVRAKIREFPQERLMLILSVYIICQPLLDILTAFGVRFGHPITAGVVVRALFMAAGFLYAVFISEFEGKRLPMIYTGVLLGYLALFMVYLLSVGGISLCFANLTDVVKTFFAPFVLVFLYCLYKQYGRTIAIRSVAWSGAIYCGVILVAFLTGTSTKSYINAGFGYNGWFYAANETGCIISLAAPFTIYYCVNKIPTITKETWWKAPLILWCLASVVFSANYIGTKVVFLFNLIYSLAALVWMLFRLWKDRSVATLYQTAAMLLLVVAILCVYRYSELKKYKEVVYDPLQSETSEEVSERWTGPINEASEDTWLRQLIADNALVGRVDAILSRRLFTASPSVQVYIEAGPLGKLLGIGYANTRSYSKDVEYMIEMDPFAILVRHGVLGFAVYIGPYLAFILYAIVQFFQHPLVRLSDLRYCTYLFTTLSAFAIALIVGHALVSPAVSIFLVIVSLNFWVVNREQNLELKQA